MDDDNEKPRSPYGDRECDDVAEFQRKFGFITSDKPSHLTIAKLTERLECLLEEVDEFEKSVQWQDLAEMADALVDLVYFAKGTAVMLGLPWRALWDDVQRANMAKERGVTKRGHSEDVMKPEGWVPPQTEQILVLAGYNPYAFADPETGTVLDENCVDYKK